MKTLLYSKIDVEGLKVTETQVVMHLQNCGYSLVKFEGFEDSDVGSAVYETNRATAKEALECLKGDFYYAHIITANPKTLNAPVLTDELGLDLVRAFSNDKGGDL